MFNFVAGTLQLCSRLTAYTYSLTDRYPLSLRAYPWPASADASTEG
jgi:hypothetical protein